MRRGPAVPGRLRRLEAAEAARRAALDPSPPLLIVHPDDWPPAELAAYEAAARDDDVAAWTAVVARNAGCAPGPRTLVIAVRERPSGPR